MLCIFFQKYEPFVDKSAKVLMAETVHQLRIECL